MAPEADELLKMWHLTISDIEAHLQKVSAFQRQKHKEIYDAAWSKFEEVRKEVENPHMSEDEVVSLVADVMAVPSKNPKAFSMRCLDCVTRAPCADHNILACRSWLGSTVASFDGELRSAAARAARRTVGPQSSHVTCDV